MLQFPLLSIIVPVYNVKPYIERCLDSIINQTYSNLDIILIDDGSTDESGTICDEYALKDSRIRVIHKQNGGLSSARNAGLEIVRGDLIAFVDSDDWIDTDTYSWLVQIYNETQADIIVFGYYEVKNRKHLKRTKNGFQDTNKIFTNTDAVNLLFEDEFLNNYVWNKLYTAKLFMRHRFTEGVTFEDIYLTYLLFLDANMVYIAGDHYKYYYFQRSSSIVHTNDYKKKKDMLEGVYSRYDHLKDDPGISREALAKSVLTSFMNIFCEYPRQSKELNDKYSFFINENSEALKSYSLHIAHKLFLHLPLNLFRMIHCRPVREIYNFIKKKRYHNHIKIGLYIGDILFRTGGTEINCAHIIYALQKTYSNPDITVFSEKYKDTAIPEWDIAAHLNKMFGLALNNHNMRLSLVYADKTSVIGRALFERRLKKASKKYDLFFNCSMNLYTFAGGKNIAIIHFPQYRKVNSPFVKKHPFAYLPALKQDNQFIHSYCLYVFYSKYVQYWFDRIWHIDSKKTKLVNIAVNMASPSNTAKKNTVFVCSRIEQSKEIEVLVAAFLASETLKNSFRLVIAGAVIGETMDYLKKLRDMIGDYLDMVTLHENPAYSDIQNYYNEAKIFWHAKGYSVIEENDPFGLEHFGITTVEAMSAGCVPVVINKGGQKEIVDEGINGFRWDTPDELVQKTILLTQNEAMLAEMSNAARIKARTYTLDQFVKNFGDMLKTKL
jgi:glycosyltransferase involved in cell wall biosynthesis